MKAIPWGWAGFSLLIGTTAYALGLVYVCSDDLTRIYWSLHWWQDPYIIRVSYWLPGHSAVFGPILAWSGHPLLAAHVLNALLCVVNLLQWNALAKKLLQDRWSVFWATLLFFFLPLRLWVGLSALTEPLFTVYFLAWISFVLDWLEKRDDRSLLYACLMGFLMGMTRQQGWVLSGLWSALVLWQGRSLRALFFAMLSMAAPIFIGAYSYLEYSDALYMVHTYVEDSRQYYQGNQPNGVPLTAFVRLYAVEALALFTGILGWRLLTPKIRWLLGIALGFYALEVLSVWNQMPTVLIERVIYFSGMFACFPAAAIGVSLWRSGSKMWKGAVGVGLAMGWGVQMMSLFEFRPNHVTPTLMHTAQRLNHSPAWMAELRSGAIATDQDPLMAYGMELIHNQTEIYGKVRIEKDQLQVKSFRPPTTFLIESDAASKILHREFPSLPSTRLGRYEVFSSKADLIREIAQKP